MEDSFELIENDNYDQQGDWEEELSVLSLQGLNNRSLLTNLLEQLGSVEGVLDYLQKSPSNTNSTVEQEETEEGSPSLTPALLEPLSIDDYFGPQRGIQVKFKKDEKKECESDKEDENGGDIPQPQRINLQISNDSTEHDIAPPLLDCLKRLSPVRPTKRYSFNAGPSSPDGLSVSRFLASPLQDLVQEPTVTRRKSLPALYRNGKETVISEYHFGSPAVVSSLTSSMDMKSESSEEEEEEEKENVPSDSGVNLLLEPSNLLKPLQGKKVEELQIILQEVMPHNTAVDISGSKGDNDVQLVVSCSGDDVDIIPGVDPIIKLVVKKPASFTILPSTTKSTSSTPSPEPAPPNKRIKTHSEEVIYCFNLTELVFVLFLTTFLFWSYRLEIYPVQSSIKQCEDVLQQSNRHTNVNLVD